MLRNVTLELSAKAFMDDTEAELRAVCRKMFHQWERLVRVSDRVSVLLWLADGSEILEYAGNPEDRFEWACWHGIANAPCFVTPDAAKGNVNFTPQKYRPDAAPRTYQWIGQLTRIIRECGLEYGKEVRIGATFDNGPEFSLSDFKYGRHREIARADSLFKKSFVTCNAVLNADTRAYAAFPEGIPAGTSLGTFLGAQFRRFAADLNFDYLWLSNGMGFGLETWGYSGALFDGHRFYPERKKEAESELLWFWRDLLDADPGIRIETRGSNFTAGIEMSTDAAPLPWLYRHNVITVPVNSPSSAIYFNTGLSVAAWMSHIAELPANGDIPFRYYIHDPWFLNSPWLDRYGREPWDLYSVMAVSRVTADGGIEAANRAAFLSCDDSFGQMPDQVPDEVIPHIMEAFRTRADAPGPLLWVFPFEEYSASDTPEQTFCEECFLVDALQSGFPLNTVISTGNFRTLAAASPGWFRQTTCVFPAECLRSEANFRAVRDLVEAGNDAIVYGTLSGVRPEALPLLGLAAGEPLTGEFGVRGEAVDLCGGDAFRNTFELLPTLHGGPLLEAAAGAKVLAAAERGGESRVLASLHSAGRGRIGFVRALSPYLEADPAAHNATLRQSRRMKGDGRENYPAERLMRAVWAELGWTFRAYVSDPGQLVPRLTVSRSDRAFYFSGYTPDTTVSVKISTPLGVPLPIEREIRIEDGAGVFHMEKTVRFHCRAFLSGQNGGVVSTKTLYRTRAQDCGRLDIIGLHGAELRFFPPSGCVVVSAVRRELGGIYGPVASASGSKEQVPVELEETPFGPCCLMRNLDGIVNITWGKAEKAE